MADHVNPTPAPAAATGGPRVDLTRATTPRSVGERLIKALLGAAALLSVATTIAIVFSLLQGTLSFFGDVGFTDYLFGTKWTPLLAEGQQSFGVIPLLVSTLYISGIALLVAIPLGLLAAIYLAEYAKPRVRKIVKPILEVLAGVPTIVFGFFALSFFTPEILQALFGGRVQIFNQLAGGILVGFLVMPTIASVAEDAMTAVPGSLREGAFGLGASRLQVALRVVFPASLSGVVAGIVLGASRAVGETVVVLLASGNGQNLPNGPVLGPGDPSGSFAAFIAGTAGGDISVGSLAYETVFAVGTTLFVMTLVLNMISIRLVNKYRQVYE